MLLITTIIFWIISSFKYKIFGLPIIYFSLITYLIDYILKFNEINKSKFKPYILLNFRTKLFFIIFLIISIYTILNSFFILNSLLYLISFGSFLLLSTFVIRCMKRDKSLSFFKNFSCFYFKKLVYTSLICAPISIGIFGLEPGNILAYKTDPNLMAFISVFMLVIFIMNKEKIFSIIIFLLGFLSESRTFIIISSVFLLSYFFLRDINLLFSKIIIKKNTLKFVLLILIFTVGIIILNPILVSISVVDNIKIGWETAKALYLGIDSGFDFDNERIKLFASNTELLKQTWPNPLGLGLKNYQENISLFAERYFVRPAKTHNFYISYAIEFGYLFPIILFSMIISLKNLFSGEDTKRGLSSLSLAFMFGLLFNEFFFCPLVLLTFLY